MTTFSIISFSLLLGCVSVLAIPANVSSSRQGRFFPFMSMSMVKFANDACVSDSGDQGVCVSTGKKCSKAGGMSSGTCSNGYGTCCVHKKMCSSAVETIKISNTHLINPARGPASCRYEIWKTKEICQIRLDFKMFNINQGSSDNLNQGFCEEDTFTISGASNSPGGALCGDLTDQHMYLDFGSSQKIDLDINTISNNNQIWDIVVTQINCNSPKLAPKGCLQYYTESSGTVKSFNFANKVQLNDQRYSVCIQPQDSMTKIKWSTCKDTVNAFTVSGPVFPPLPPGPAPQNPIRAWVGAQCYNDWVEVYGADKFCGTTFKEVTSLHRPFMLGVNFNGYEKIVPPSMNCGTQTNPCWGTDGQPITPPTPPPLTLIESLDIDNAGFCLRYVCTPF